MGIFRFFIFSFLLSLSWAGHSQLTQLNLGFGNDLNANVIRQGEFSSITVDTNLLLMQALNQYKIKPLFIPPARAEVMLAQDPNFCMTNRLKTPQRQSKYRFSTPINLYVGHRLYWTGNERLPADLINREGQLVSLPALFERFPRRKIIMLKSRSFGKLLDKQIKVLQQRNLVVRPGMDDDASTVSMLLKGRVDYLLEYPIDVKRVLGNRTNTELTSIAIAASTPFVVGHIMCSDTETGRNIVKDINTALRRLYATEDFYYAHTRYLDRADIPDFDRYYYQVLQQSPPPD